MITCVKSSEWNHDCNLVKKKTILYGLLKNMLTIKQNNKNKLINNKIKELFQT